MSSSPVRNRLNEKKSTTKNNSIQLKSKIVDDINEIAW
jgi:hypothetical protein